MEWFVFMQPPPPALSPSPGGLRATFFKCRAEYFKHCLKSVIYRQIFRRVLSSFGAKVVPVCSSPHCCALGSDSKGQGKDLKCQSSWPKLDFCLWFRIFSSPFNAFITTSLKSPTSCPGGGSGRASITPQTRRSESSQFTEDRIRDCCASQHSKQLQFRVFEEVSPVCDAPSARICGSVVNKPEMCKETCSLESQEEKNSSESVIANHWVLRQF